MNKNHSHGQRKNGFALLMTLVVVSVLVSIGLSVLQLSISQVRLATNARDSEIAFHATNAGLECARYVRRLFSEDMENIDDPGAPLSISPVCFDVNASPNSRNEVTVDVAGNGSVHQYDYSFTWDSSGSERCSQVNTIILIAEGPGTLSINSPQDVVPGYDGASIDCEAGERCTVLSVQGFNKSCANISSAGTIQREVLLEF